MSSLKSCVYCDRNSDLVKYFAKTVHNKGVYSSFSNLARSATNEIIILWKTE